MKQSRKSIALFFAVFLMAVFLSSCFHVMVQENVAKGKFSKKYNCKFKDIELVEDDLESQKDSFKLVGCGVTAYYEGTEETMSDSDQ